LAEAGDKSRKVNYNKTNSTAVEIILEEIFTDSE
jgi:hypothetical protein